MGSTPLQDAATLARAGDWPGAERACLRALEAAPGDAAGWRLLGEILTSAGRPADAQTAFGRATDCAPGDAALWKRRAVGALASGAIEEAVLAASNAAKLTPTDAWAHFLRGHAEALAKRWTDAEASFARAAELNPAMAEARAGLVGDAQVRRAFDTAAFHAAAEVRRTPDEPAAIRTLGRAIEAIDPDAAELLDLDRRAIALELEHAAERGDAARHAVELFRAARWDEAGLAFVEWARRDPTHALARRGLLLCAERAARCGDAALVVAEANAKPNRSEMISIIVCSITPAKLDRLCADLDRCFAAETWELIAIADARSLAEAYTRGTQRARGDVLVFCHDDIGLLRADFAARLRGHLARHDLVGVAGTTELIGPAWHWAGPPAIHSWVATPRGERGLLATMAGCESAVVPNALALDGVFLAARRHVVEQIGFDADAFDGFHLYDIDFSHRAALAGFDCAIALDLSIWHASAGRYDANWRRYADRLVAKFPNLAATGPRVPFETATLALASLDDYAPIAARIEHWLSRR